MYAQDEGDDELEFKQDIMDYFEKYSIEGYVVSSSCPDFTDADGDCPPHKKARDRYEEIVAAGQFICTHEYPTKGKPEPLVFTIDSSGFGFDDKRTKGSGGAALAAAINVARGAVQPPTTQVGFGGTA
jgi:hypothetical protein